MIKFFNINYIYFQNLKPNRFSKPELLTQLCHAPVLQKWAVALFYLKTLAFSNRFMNRCRWPPYIYRSPHTRNLSVHSTSYRGCRCAPVEGVIQFPKMRCHDTAMRFYPKRKEKEEEIPKAMVDGSSFPMENLEKRFPTSLLRFLTRNSTHEMTALGTGLVRPLNNGCHGNLGRVDSWWLTLPPFKF